jgi:hypothetical protein
MESTLQRAALLLADGRTAVQSNLHRLLDLHRTCLPGDGLHHTYYELVLLPESAQAFTRLGFPSDSFRVQLAWAKVVGVAALLLPMVPARLKEWAYAGFAVNLVSALIAHLSISDQPLAFVESTITGVLWALSYFFWRGKETV